MFILCLVLVAANVYVLYPRKKAPTFDKKLENLKKQIKSGNNKRSSLRYRLSRCEYEKSQQNKNFNHNLSSIMKFYSISSECGICLCTHAPIELIITICCGLQIVCKDCTSMYKKCLYCRKSLMLN